MGSSELMSIADVGVKKETTSALLCKVGDAEVWIPKSLVHEDSDVNEEGDEGTLVIPEWLAIERGLA